MWIPRRNAEGYEKSAKFQLPLCCTHVAPGALTGSFTSASQYPPTQYRHHFLHSAPDGM